MALDVLTMQSFKEKYIIVPPSHSSSRELLEFSPCEQLLLGKQKSIYHVCNFCFQKQTHKKSSMHWAPQSRCDTPGTDTPWGSCPPKDSGVHSLANNPNWKKQLRPKDLSLAFLNPCDIPLVGVCPLKLKNSVAILMTVPIVTTIHHVTPWCTTLS